MQSFYLTAIKEHLSEKLPKEITFEAYKNNACPAETYVDLRLGNCFVFITFVFVNDGWEIWWNKSLDKYTKSHTRVKRDKAKVYKFLDVVDYVIECVGEFENI